nr:hypothetical protein [Tanacetum cinerariifolium]
MIQNEFIILSLEQFGSILRIPFIGQSVFITEWDLSSLSAYQEPEDPYHTELTTPDDIHQFLQFKCVDSSRILRAKTPLRSHDQKGCHSTSSSSAVYQGSSFHQFNDDKEIQDESTPQNSTSSPTTYFNSLSPVHPQVFIDPKSHEQNMSTLFSRQTSMLNRQERMHVEHQGALKSLGKAIKGAFMKKKKK